MAARRRVPSLHFPKGRTFSDVDEVSAPIMLKRSNLIRASDDLTDEGFVALSQPSGKKAPSSFFQA
jgi:hypothetical protein